VKAELWGLAVAGEMNLSQRLQVAARHQHNPKMVWY